MSARPTDKRHHATSPLFEIVPPEASALVESLRAFGYTTETAIADLIDNSLTAGARKIWIDFDWDGADSSVRVSDNGSGMSEAELTEAMRPGSRNPKEKRDPSDLGRFGLGLKTASFSQCRRMTVLTRQNGSTPTARCWDLDVLGETHEWRLLEIDPAQALSHSRVHDLKAGTEVRWDKVDRILGAEDDPDDDASHKRFLELIRSVQQHLSVTFHRFMSGREKVSFFVNGARVTPWDPFLTGSEGLQVLEPESLPFRGESIRVQPFVLPHRSRFDDEEFESAGLGGKWNDLQGFYVYRNRRLLVTGDYLGLGFQKEEHYKLVRISIDIPNALDEAWQIDVRKSMARPPGPLRVPLKRIAQAARARAVEVYRHRGKAITRKSAGGVSVAWSQKLRQGKIVYAINREHPVLAALRADLASSKDRELRLALKLIEETVPIPLIAINASERSEEQAAPFEGDEGALRRVASQLYSTFRRQGMSKTAAIARLASTEPFDLFPEVIASLAEAGPTDSEDS